MSIGEKRRRVVSRRSFLRGIGTAAAGLLATGCCPRALIEAVESTATAEPTVTLVPTAVPTHASTATPTTVPSSTPTGAPTAMPTGAPTAAPTAAPTSAPTATPEPAFRSRVAIGRVDSYDRTLIRQQVEALLDGIGGLGDVVGLGDRVAIKVNLTGGTAYDGASGLPGTESFVTHPEVVRALGELLWDAGAGELLIVEAVYEWDSYRRWGYEDVAAALGATLIDLNSPAPYADFASTPVGGGAFVYDSFFFNHVLEEVDAFVSVAKMKCHWYAGVTASIKNLVGLVPVASYRLGEDHLYRSALHGPTDEETRTRLPRVITDLVRARPIDLALIDGVRTAEGGEGPWIGCFNPVQPGVVIAGKNAVATDAVAAAAMGFDPAADYPAAPFLRGESHLNLAHGLGLGTNRLGEIGVVGAAIDEVRYPFNPCWS
jgi:uncharacterized protein (DUF362 family)